MENNVPSRGKTTSGLNRDVQEIVLIFIVFSGNKSLRKCVTAPFDGFEVIMTNEGYTHYVYEKRIVNSETF